MSLRIATRVKLPVVPSTSNFIRFRAMEPVPNFSYVIGEAIAASADPRFAPTLVKGLQYLREQGIGAILALNEAGGEEAVAREFGFEFLHLPVEDFRAPTIEQIGVALEFMREQAKSDSAVLVHCSAGQGRTGTILACYLVHEGQSAEQAMRDVRSLRPGSIETTIQERAIREYEQHRRENSAGQK